MSAPLSRPSASSGAGESGCASSRGKLSGAHQRQAVEVAAVVVVMGVGGSSGIGEGKGSGGNKANSGDSNGRGPYNNQLKDPVEETRWWRR
jgi:hypothetical protein